VWHAHKSNRQAFSSPKNSRFVVAENKQLLKSIKNPTPTQKEQNRTF